MILFGAGASTPFGIPGMKEFTDQFVRNNVDLSEFLTSINEGISKSKEYIGTDLPFDLETLLSVLNDLSGVTNEKPVSIPTTSLLLNMGLSLNKAKEKFGLLGTILLGKQYVQMGQIMSLSNPVYLDVGGPHVILVSGKRGSGKSYTLGVIAEGLA